jgi:hypothetical protein
MTDDTTFTTERPARTRRFTDKAIATWADFKPGLKRKVVPVPGKLGHFIVVQPQWSPQLRRPGPRCHQQEAGLDRRWTLRSDEDRDRRH